MKSARVTLLSALIVLGFVLPVRASDDNHLLPDTSTPILDGPIKAAVADIARNCFSGWSNTTIGTTLVVITGAGLAAGYGVFRLMGGNAVALKAQDGINKALEQKTLFELGTKRDTKLAQDEAYIEEAINLISKLPASLKDEEYIRKVIESNEHRNRVKGFYKTCNKHKEHLAQVTDPELKEKAKQVRKLLRNCMERAQAISELRIYQDQEDQQAEALKKAQLNNSIRAQSAKQLELMNEGIIKKDDRDAETHRVHRTTIQEMQKDVNTISATISGIHNWQQTSIKQIDRYMPSITAASQNCANLKDALSNVATQEQLTHGMAALAKAFGHESTLMKTLVTIQENQKAQSMQLAAQNNKLDAQGAKLNELEKKINATEQHAAMSNPANWDARKNPTATAVASAPKEPTHFDPTDEIDDGISQEEFFARQQVSGAGQHTNR